MPRRRSRRIFRTFEGLNVGVQVVDLDADLDQIFGQVFRHFLGQRRDQNALALFGTGADFVDQVVDLPFGRANDDLGVDQTRSGE